MPRIRHIHTRVRSEIAAQESGERSGRREEKRAVPLPIYVSGTRAAQPALQLRPRGYLFSRSVSRELRASGSSMSFGDNCPAAR